jgi:hypothetical protein
MFRTAGTYVKLPNSSGLSNPLLLLRLSFEESCDLDLKAGQQLGSGNLTRKSSLVID